MDIFGRIGLVVKLVVGERDAREAVRSELGLGDEPKSQVCRMDTTFVDHHLKWTNSVG